MGYEMEGSAKGSETKRECEREIKLEEGAKLKQKIDCSFV